MNFWEFKEDNSRGYWSPVPPTKKVAHDNSGQLVRDLLYISASIAKLAWAAIVTLFSFLSMIVVLLWRLRKR